MRIFDENNREISEQDIDLTKGKLIAHERVLIKHHEAILEIAEVSREVPGLVYPTQGSEGIPVDNYEGELSEAFGVETQIDIITPYQAAVEAWDEYEDAQTYISFNESELAEHRVAELKSSLVDISDDVIIALITRLETLEAAAGRTVRRNDVITKRKEIQREILKQQDIITAAKTAESTKAAERRKA